MTHPMPIECRSWLILSVFFVEYALGDCEF